VAELPALDGVLISHHHYDHCDLKAFRAYRDRGAPMLVAAPVAARARRHGFTNVTPLAPWHSAQIGGVTVTAAPARHAVYEVTCVLSDGTHTVYFTGDTMLIPELAQLPDRFGHVDIALLPTNGLRIRPQGGKQVVMNAAEAAELTAILKPDLAIPHHYAFTSGWLGDRLLTMTNQTPGATPTPLGSWPPPPRCGSPSPAPGWRCDRQRCRYSTGRHDRRAGRPEPDGRPDHAGRRHLPPGQRRARPGDHEPD
jgi:beta-lactamase family protein